MNRDTTRFAAALQERLAAARQEKLEFIGAGVDTEMYRHWTGYIRGLKDVSAIIAEVRKKFEEE
jgi:hypothetical protein